jgi:xylulokinase
MKKTATYLLGVDIGSSACKGSIVDFNGILVSHTTTDYTIETDEQDRENRTKRNNWAELDPEVWFDAFRTCIQTCLKSGNVKAHELVAMSVCGPAHNAVLFDENNAVLRPVILWWDKRSAEQSAWLDRHFGDEIFDITCQPVHPSWTLSQLLWIREREPYTFRRIRRLLIGKDYITYRLTGSWKTDWYDAMGTQLLDGKSRTWSERICSILELPLSCLPPVEDPFHISGYVSAQAAKETGLPEGLPVAVGSGDSVVEAFGVAALNEGDCLVKLATTGTVSIVTKKPHPNRKYMTYFHVLPDLYYLIAATNSGASSLQWFNRVFRQGQQKSYEYMEEIARKISPGCDGLIYHPYLTGERSPYWDPNLRGDFVGISSHHDFGHFVRAVLEGVAFSLRDCAEIYRELDIPVKRAIIVGGGARLGLWRSITANALNMQLLVPRVPSPQVTTFGAAILAGYACERIERPLEIKSLTEQYEEIVEPRVEITRKYDKLFMLYKEITAKMQPLYTKIAGMHL